jgi:hypothetical protein
MRIFVVKKGSSPSKVLGATSAAQLSTLQAFNPHLDLKKLTPGAVIMVPDDAGDVPFPSGDPQSIGAEAMDSFISFAKDALSASSQRMRQAADRAKAEESALAVALKSRGVGQAMDKDAELRALVEGAARQAQDDSKSAAADAQSFDALAKAAQAELAELTKRLA